MTLSAHPDFVHRLLGALILSIAAAPLVYGALGAISAFGPAMLYVIGPLGMAISALGVLVLLFEPPRRSRLYRLAVALRLPLWLMACALGAVLSGFGLLTGTERVELAGLVVLCCWACMALVTAAFPTPAARAATAMPRPLAWVLIAVALVGLDVLAVSYIQSSARMP